MNLGRASLVAKLIENPPAIWETWVRSLGWEDPLEKGKATHCSILAWIIPWTVSPWGRRELDTTEQLSLSLSFQAEIYHLETKRESKSAGWGAREEQSTQEKLQKLMDKKHKPRKLDNHNRIYATTSPKHTYLDIMVKLLEVKCKEKISKAASKNGTHYIKRVNITTAADFFSKTRQDIRQWSGICKALKESSGQPRFLYPGKTFFKKEGKSIN